MKVLYLGPINESSSVNGGYGYVANSFNTFLTDLKNKNKLSLYTTIDTNTKEDQVKLYAEYDVGVILTHPASFDNPRFKKNISNVRKYCKNFYLHIFWETDSLNSKWDWLFQKDSMFTGFIASSDFNKKIILDKVNQFKSNQRVHKVYPLIKDSSVHIDIETKKKENKFTVLYMGQYTKRKGFEDAIISFVHALGDKEDCQLYLKYHRLSKVEFEDNELIQRTVGMNCTNFKSHIYSITDNLDRDQINNLYTNSSVLLFLSRGEGFGLPLTEASIIGLPIIYADNSSCNEVVGHNNYRVPCIQDSAIGMSHYGYESGSLYGVPIMKYAIDHLKNCYNLWKTNKEEYYKSNNGKTLLKLFGEENITKQIKELL